MVGGSFRRQFLFSEGLLGGCVARTLSANIGAHKTFYERKVIKVVKWLHVLSQVCAWFVDWYHDCTKGYYLPYTGIEVVLFKGGRTDYSSGFLYAG
jgi:hypothetical protein